MNDVRSFNTHFKAFENLAVSKLLNSLIIHCITESFEVESTVRESKSMMSSVCILIESYLRLS